MKTLILQGDGHDSNPLVPFGPRPFWPLPARLAKEVAGTFCLL